MTLEEWTVKNEYKVYHYPNGSAHLYIQSSDPRFKELRNLVDFDLSSYVFGMASLEPRRLTLKEWLVRHGCPSENRDNGLVCLHVESVDRLESLFELKDYRFSMYAANRVWLSPRRVSNDSARLGQAVRTDDPEA